MGPAPLGPQAARFRGRARRSAVRLALGLLLALGALHAAAQVASTSAPADLVAQPLDGIVVGDLRISVDGPRSASLRVETTIDVACVAVFGPDTSFGRLALDAQMGAAAHRDHVVIMSGLEPDTTYVVRLQGSGTDGTFYASRILSFQTPPATAEPDLGVDVATAARGARVVDVSSGYGSSELEGRWGGANAIDGDPGTEWSSDGDGDAAAITVELAESVQVTGFGLWTRTMGDSAQIEAFEVVAEDGTVYGPFEVGDAGALHRFAAEAEGRRFTFRVVRSSGGNTGAVEIAVFSRDIP